MCSSDLWVYYCSSFQEKYEQTKNQLLAVGKEGQNKKELEDALSALSVEEQELKKREEEFKVKEKVLTITIYIFYTLFFIGILYLSTKGLICNFSTLYYFARP